MGRVDLDKAALVLVEASFFGDGRTAKKWGITCQTVSNYRKRLNTDKDFVKLYDNKRLDYQTNWMEELPIAIRAGVTYLLNTIPTLGNSPEEIHATVGAIKILAEIGITKELLDAKLNGLGEDRAQDRQLPDTTEGNKQTIIMDSES